MSQKLRNVVFLLFYDIIMKMCEQQYNLNRKMDVTVECVRRIGSTNQAEVVNMLLSMVSQFTTYREIRYNLFSESWL